MKNNAKSEWALCFVVFYIFVIVLTWMALGGASADEWKLEVIGFDFATAEVLLQDEDGYVWTCPFGENDWELGQEYILILEDGQADICE